jgi:16S rRNA (adenine1518-N6/adenine1519-N6)-dimethyltransferase
MKNIKPLKRFGQNYLIDRNVIIKLVNELNPHMDDQIVEIGPGTGTITEELLNRTQNITAIEIDKRVIDNLRRKFSKLKIINEDFIKISLNEISNQKRIKVIGNIPFNLTSSIIFKLIENREQIEDAVFIVQYEVAKKFFAKNNTKDFGIYSVILNYFADARFCFKISPNVFFPKPKVFSAAVHLSFTKEIDISIDDKLFINVVKASFGKRRKTLKNSLSNSIFKNCDFSGLTLDLSKRAEQLDIPDFITLTSYIQDQKYDS